MRRIIYILLLVVFVAHFCGCSSFQIQGIDNFTEMDCCFGLTLTLMPEDRKFLTQYPYDDGIYQYWRNNCGPAEAKAFICLQYSEEVYRKAKEICQEYYNFSKEVYYYDCLAFYVFSLGDDAPKLDPNYPGFRLFGYNDEQRLLIFAAYLNEDAKIVTEESISKNFTEFFNKQFGAYLRTD